MGILEFPGPGGPYPVALLFHGAGGGKETVSDEAERYRREGLATLRVDLPGFGETTVQVTGTLRDAEVLREVITAVLAHDHVDGLDGPAVPRPAGESQPEPQPLTF